MKKNLLFFTLFFVSGIFYCCNNFKEQVPSSAVETREGASSACKKLASSVWQATVNTRHKVYAKKRKGITNPVLRDTIPFIPETFRDLLDSIIHPSDPHKNYTGVRVYFAAYPGPGPKEDSGRKHVPELEFGQATLIFVPTTDSTDANNNKYQRDDTLHCWTLNGKNVDTISPKTASQWINKAINTYLDTFEKARKQDDPSFLETKALWYSASIIASSSNTGRLGMRDYLDCRIKEKSIDYVYTILCAFGLFDLEQFKDYHYKLSLFYNFHTSSKSGGEDDYESLFFADFSDSFKEMLTDDYKLDSLHAKQKGQQLSDPSSNTGKPCPEPPCNQDGGLLPGN